MHVVFDAGTCRRAQVHADVDPLQPVGLAQYALGELRQCSDLVHLVRSAVAVLIRQRHDAVRAALRDEQHATWRQCHESRAGQILGEDVHRVAVRDGKGRFSTTSAVDGSLPSAVRCRQVGPNGRVLETVTAEGHRARYAYDGEGRLRSVVAGDLGASAEPWDDACPAAPSGASVAGTLVTYEHDRNGRLIAATDGRGLRTTWQYDGFGRSIIDLRSPGSRIAD